MRSAAFPAVLRATVALACVFGALPAAQAQDIHIAAPSPSAAATPGSDDDAQPVNPLTPSESAALGNALLFDPANLVNAKPAPKLRVPSLTRPRNLSINGRENLDGTSKVAVKQPLANDGWDANIGADLKTAAPPPVSFEPGKPFPGTVDDHGSGSAWASVGVPNLASVDARVDPTNDQGQVGAALKRSVPLGDQLSVTVQNRFSVTESYAALVPAPAPSSALPLMAAPKPTGPVLPGPAQVLGDEKTVKLDIKPTGTTFGAGLTSASNDPVTHNTFSADQKLYGALHVTTTVTDIGQASSNKSITAGFKLDW
jgi:hypothetical protein